MNKLRDYKPPPNTQAVHIVPMAFDVYGRCGARAEAGSETKAGKAGRA